MVSLSHPPGDVDSVTATGANTCDPVSEASSLLEPMCYVCSAAASGSFGLDCLRWWMPITRSSASLRSIALSSASAVLREARVGVGLPVVELPPARWSAAAWPQRFRAVITATTKPVIICRRRNMLVPNHPFVMLSNTGPNK